MPDPFNRFSNSVLWPTLLIALILSVLLLIAMSLVDRSLKTSAAPSGIVSFELAGSLNKGQKILESWNTQGKMYAALSLGVDYLFMIVYALFISTADVLIARRLIPKYVLWGKLGYILGWSQFLAAFLDAIENFVLIRLLLGSQIEAWPVIARWCAVVKFAIVGAGLIYILVGLVSIGLQKVFGSRNS